MAYTKIKAVKNHLQRCLDYTSNPRKTESGQDLKNLLAYTQNSGKTEHQLYVTGFNCDPANACEIMQRTKKQWGKDGGNHVLAYHVIQSFKPGEVTPQQAHEIGCEFVRRAFGNRFEATVSTHLNTGALHNHIVFNSVSFTDGRMFRNDFRGYYKGIREISDTLCREKGLSVIEPKQKGRSYDEWQAKQKGEPTVRDKIRMDVDRALEKAVSWETFIMLLRHMDYTVKYGRNVKYATIRHKSGGRNIRLKSLGEGYDEESLRNLLARRARGEKVTMPGAAAQSDVRFIQPKRRIRRMKCRGALPVLPKQKITGFMALYYRYVYLLRRTKQRRTTRRCFFLLYEDLRRFDQYCAQFRYIRENHIVSQADLTAAKEKAAAAVADLTAQRSQLYRKRSSAGKAGKEKAAEALTAEIRELTIQLRACRKEAALCGAIEENAQRLREQLSEAEREERRAAEQQTQSKPRRGREHEQRQ